MGSVLRLVAARFEDTSREFDDVLLDVIRMAVHLLLFISTKSFGEYSSINSSWLGVSFLGIFCSGLAYVTWYNALQVLSTAQAGVFLYIKPPVSVVAAFFVLSKAITSVYLIGDTVILFGVWLVNQEPG